MPASGPPGAATPIVIQGADPGKASCQGQSPARDQAHGCGRDPSRPFSPWSSLPWAGNLDSADPDFEQKVLAATAGEGLEVAFDFAGATPVRSQALSVLAQGGKLVLVGLSGRPFTVEDSTAFQQKQLQIVGHFGAQDGAIADLIRLEANGRIEFSRSVSDVLPLEEAADAVERLLSKKGDPIRLLLRP
ncbi:zinc-binding dehydrogenase [Streptomyces sp. NPDC001393]